MLVDKSTIFPGTGDVGFYFLGLVNGLLAPADLVVVALRLVDVKSVLGVDSVI